MTMKLNGGMLKAACLSLALLGGTALAVTLALPDQALAKNGNGGGNGKGGTQRGGNGDAGGTSFGGSSSSSKQASGKRSQQTKTMKINGAGSATKAIGQKSAHKNAVDGLTPSQQGKWNAAHANQNALDAHIRNQNFNGTIGALAQFQLAAKAAAGEDLTEAEQAAVDAILGEIDITVDDQALADILNADVIDGDPVYSVEAGIVSCSENCDTADLDAAQATLDAEVARLEAEAQQAALAEFLSASEARIVEESNKSLSPDDTEKLLGEIASTLGVVRASVSSDGDPVDDPVTQPDVPLITDG